jgi:Putative DNA-binding domain
MENTDLAALVTAKSEALEVEYKSWIDTSVVETSAKLARHLAALSNHGGGYLIFGVNDKTKLPEGATALDPKLFGEDAISAIVKCYLDPRFQCRVEWAEYGGVSYPVIIVPSHAARPVVAIADGPPDQKGRPTGIREGALYIRSAGPERIAIRGPDDWTTLLERCLRHRADMLASIMRQAIGSSSKPSLAATNFLKAACRATAESFATQIRDLVPEVAAEDQPRVLEMADNFAVLGYALLGEDGELLPLENVRSLNARADVAMHQYAYIGWNSFLPVRVPERAPQLRTEPLLDDDRSYLEGLRIANSAFVGATFDYWRMYEDGVCCFAEGYRDDFQGRSDRLGVALCLLKLHSILAHARLVGQEMPAIGRIVIYMDWKGLAGRCLMLDRHSFVSPTRVADDRFSKTITLDWAEIRNDYFGAFRKISLPFLDLFATPGWLDPVSWLTRERVEQLFASLHAQLRLF